MTSPGLRMPGTAVHYPAHGLDHHSPIQSPLDFKLGAKIATAQEDTYKSPHVRMRPAHRLQSSEGPSMSYPRCRLCSAELRHTFVDLGMSPPCESYLTAAQLDAAEKFYPLHVRVCESCLLVQLPAYIAPEDVFSDYAYFSSYSDSWVAHARRFVDDATGEVRARE